MNKKKTILLSFCTVACLGAFALAGMNTEKVEAAQAVSDVLGRAVGGTGGNLLPLLPQGGQGGLFIGDEMGRAEAVLIGQLGAVGRGHVGVAGQMGGKDGLKGCHSTSKITTILW